MIVNNESIIMITTILEIVISWFVRTSTIEFVLLTILDNYNIGLYK